jgi:hypothetical protein
MLGGASRRGHAMVPYPASAFLMQVLRHYFLWMYALKKGDLLPLVDAVADRLPSWKANLMNKAGRTTYEGNALRRPRAHLHHGRGLAMDPPRY